MLEAAPSPGPWSRGSVPAGSPRPLHRLPRRRAGRSRGAGPPAPRPPPIPTAPAVLTRSPRPRAAARPSAPARRLLCSAAARLPAPGPREVSAPGQLGLGPGQRARQCGDDSGCRPPGRGDPWTFSKAGSPTSPAAENSKSSLRIKAFVGSGGEGLGSRSLSFRGPH